MSRDKQIEEMAKVMCTDCADYGDCKYNGACECILACAKTLYNAGYRKTSEIFEEIDRMIYRLLNDKHYIVGDMCYEVAELKKKYTESEKK